MLTTLYRLMKKAVPTPGRTGRHARPAGPRFRPHLEQLEDRRLLTGGVFLQHLNSGVYVNSYAGVGFQRNTVATLFGPPGLTTANTPTLIAWGDGGSSSGELVDVGGNGPGAEVYQVKGTHVYQQLASQERITVQVVGQTDPAETAEANVAPMPNTLPGSQQGLDTGAPATAPENVMVQLQHLNSGVYVNTTVGDTRSQVVGTLLASLNGQPDPYAGDFRAWINWGNSSQWSPGWVTGGTINGTGSVGVFTISGSPPPYAQPSDRIPITVYVTGPDGTSTSAETAEAIVGADTSFSAQARSEAVGSDGNLRLLATSTDGSAAVWTVSAATGQATAGPHYGPYAGWTATKIATGADGLTRLLWTSTGGTASLWVLGPAGNYLSSANYGPYAGWSAVDIAVGGDGDTRLLWTYVSGTAVVWDVNTTSGAVATSPHFGPYGGWSASHIALGSDGDVRLLWTGTGGQASLWTLDAGGNFLGALTYGPYAGWAVSDLSVGADGGTRLLWTNTNGSAVVWNVNTATGQVSSSPGFGPAIGWGATHLAAAPAGPVWLLWDGLAGAVSLWALDAYGNFLQARTLQVS